MKTVVTIVQPVEADICRECRFCSHILELEPVQSGTPDVDTLVCCLRSDCDNAHAERLLPLLPCAPEPENAPVRRPDTRGLIARCRQALRTFVGILFAWNNSFVRYPDRPFQRQPSVDSR